MDQNQQDLINFVIQAVSKANLNLWSAMQNMQKQLVMEEPRGPSQLIEIQVLNAGITKQNFPDIQQLRSQQGQNIIVKAIKLIDVNVLTNGPISGLPNAPITELAKISLVIYCEGWEKAQQIPLNTMNPMFTEGTGQPFATRTMRFNNWQKIDWTKTFLQWSNSLSSVGAPYCIMFDVEYEKLDSLGVPIVGPS